jgi:N-acetylglucosamine kinase-like BadF-type ATPase
VTAPPAPAADGWGGPVLGVDGGGTGCRAVLLRGGAVARRWDLGPLNVLLHADAVDRLAGLISDTGAVAAGMGLAGIRDTAHAEKLSAELTARTGATVVVRDDTEAALAGAFSGGPGVVVIAGTGSGALGRDAAGRLARAGGHGFLLGDEGGGYWIGREAVRAALRAGDLLAPPTALADVVRAAFGDLVGAVQEVHRNPTDRTLLTRLVPAVVDAATAGDAVAGRLLADAATALADLAAAVRTALAGENGPAGNGPARNGPSGHTPSGNRPAGNGPAGQTPSGNGPTGNGPTRNGPTRNGPARNGLAGHATAGNGPAGEVLAVAMVGGIFAAEPIRARFVRATGATAPAEPAELGAVRLLPRPGQDPPG